MKKWRVIYWLTKASIKINKHQILVTALQEACPHKFQATAWIRDAALIHQWIWRGINGGTPGSWV